MNPAGVSIRAFHVKPQPIPLHDLCNVAVKKLGHLRGSYIGLAQHRRDRRDGGDALGQCSGQSIFVEVFGASGGSGRFARQDLQSVTPLKLQMMHRKVPQSVHG